MDRRSLFRAPELRSGEHSERVRGSTWLELFFDLVFVIAITQLALALGGDLSVRGFPRFALLFTPVWWAWVGYTNYADRFDNDDLGFRLLMLGAMLGIAVLAVAIPVAFHHGSAVFAAAYAAVRALLIVLYARARRSVPEARSLCNMTVSVFVIGTTLWLVSLLVPEPARFAFWGVALLIEGSTPWVARKAMSAVPYHASHLPERYGLFTLIVLGEGLVAVVLGVRSTAWHTQAVTVAVLGFVCAAALWWLYFDSIERSAVQRTLVARNTFIYGHLLIAAGLTMSGVGIRQTIRAAATHGDLTSGARWALYGGATMFLVALSAVRAVSNRGVHELRLAARAAVAGGLILAAAIASARPVVLIAALALALCALVALDIRHPQLDAAATP